MIATHNPNIDGEIDAVYGGVPTFTGTAPTTLNGRLCWQRAGYGVFWSLHLSYTNAGVTVTNMVVPFPAQLPTPMIANGWSGASAHLFNMDSVRLLTSTSSAITNAGAFMLRRNAADNGFEISSPSTFTSGSWKAFILSGFYWAAPQ